MGLYRMLLIHCIIFCMFASCCRIIFKRVSLTVFEDKHVDWHSRPVYGTNSLQNTAEMMSGLWNHILTKHSRYHGWPMEPYPYKTQYISWVACGTTSLQTTVDFTGGLWDHILAKHSRYHGWHVGPHPYKTQWIPWVAYGTTSFQNTVDFIGGLWDHILTKHSRFHGWPMGPHRYKTQ